VLFALTDVCLFVNISYYAALAHKKEARFAFGEQFMLANPHIKQAALRTAGATMLFSHTT